MDLASSSSFTALKSMSNSIFSTHISNTYLNGSTIYKSCLRHKAKLIDIFLYYLSVMDFTAGWYYKQISRFSIREIKMGNSICFPEDLKNNKADYKL
jgi:hypothetical protein